MIQNNLQLVGISWFDMLSLFFYGMKVSNWSCFEMNKVGLLSPLRNMIYDHKLTTLLIKLTITLPFVSTESDEWLSAYLF